MKTIYTKWMVSIILSAIITTTTLQINNYITDKISDESFSLKQEIFETIYDSLDLAGIDELILRVDDIENSNELLLSNQSSLLSNDANIKSTLSSMRKMISKNSTSAKPVQSYSKTTKSNKTKTRSKGKKNYFEETPYTTFEEFIVYWMKDDGIKPFVEKYNIPARTILTRFWKETNGGTAGSAGRQGALFAVKAGKGDKDVIYAKDDKFVKGKKVKSKFKKYKSRAEAISDFCHKLNKPSGMYKIRYNAWTKVHPKMASWKRWALAMQVHPQLSKSRYAYATNFVEQYNKKGKTPKYRHMKTHKKISGTEFYRIRKSSAIRSIKLTMEFDKVFKKYGY